MGICGLGHQSGPGGDERDDTKHIGVATRSVSRKRGLKKMLDTSEQPYLLESLPSLVTVHNVLTRLSPEDLCAFTRTSRGNQTLVSGNDEVLWGPIVEREWGPDSLVSAAVAIAGTRRAYAMQKRRSSRPLPPNRDGWKRPCEYDLCAMQDRVLAAARHQGGSEKTPTAIAALPPPPSQQELLTRPSCRPTATTAHVIFLLDGSGSVGDEEFSASAAFIVQATAALKAQGDCKVSVAQFSTDVRTEWEDAPAGPEVDPSAFEATIKSMVRINGGTNIAAAFSYAGKMFKKQACEPNAAKLVILMTDGRVDTYQSKEAQQVTTQLADEHPNTTLFAFGVGRGIDRAECIAMIEAGRPANGCKFPRGSERYIDLFFKDEGPW